ncbi:hypothetical protein [Rhodococcus koreensis]|uniref:hypothetical protein n=1 Tax=Rhodococcus koreensis TaxID=99653 RepID=UPI00197D70F7|nr:hypothetical protein [Rhodococcus koreensis]QSE86197.1 hypothetical protein JWS14_45060 [Rhodococcus koreensis]
MVTAGAGLVLAGVLTLVLVRVEDPTSGHWPAVDLTLRTVALMCGPSLLAGGVLCCVWARPLSCYVDDDSPRS